MFEIAKDESRNHVTDESGDPVYIHPSLEFMGDVDVNEYTRQF